MFKVNGMEGPCCETFFKSSISTNSEFCYPVKDCACIVCIIYKECFWCSINSEYSIFFFFFGIIVYLYSAQYLHILQDSKRYFLTDSTAQVQPQLTSD